MKSKRTKKQLTNVKPKKTIDKAEPLPAKQPNNQYAGPVIRIRHTNNSEIEYHILNKATDKKGDRSDDKRLSPNKCPPTLSILTSKSADENLKPVFEEKNTAEWKCFICQRKPNQLAMGDLYGPYFMDEKYSLYLPSDSSGGHNSSVPHLKQIWFHEDCIVWTPNVLLLQDQLLHFDTIMKELSFIKCIHCLKPRATMACCTRGCHYSALHFPCARELGCQLEERTFTVYCGKHKGSPPPKKDNCSDQTGTKSAVN